MVLQATGTAEENTARLLFQFGENRGDKLGHIAHHPIIGDLEDGRLGVAVDRDDGLALVHAGEMLNRAGDADSNVEFGLNGFARLSHLLGVRPPTRVDNGAGRSDGCAELVGQRFDKLGEALGTPNAAPANPSNPLSASNWRINRGRSAPRDMRIAISRCRTAALASSRFATFAQAISSTKPTAPANTQIDWRARCTSESFRVITSKLCPFSKTFGNCWR